MIMASARFGRQKDRPFRMKRNNKGEVIVTKGKLISQLSKEALFKLAEQTNIPKDAQKARKEIQKRGLTFPVVEENTSLV
jgi:hypothetical protein